MLGQVAGSVGHELRNPLGVMSNAVYFLQTVLGDKTDDVVREYLDIIKNEIAGSERIVSDLLDSVRTRPPNLETVGVQEIIELTLVKLALPPTVRIKVDIPETLPRAAGGRTADPPGVAQPDQQRRGSHGGWRRTEHPCDDRRGGTKDHDQRAR